MNAPSHHVDGHLSLPAEQFYWGVVDTSALPRGNRSTPKQLGYLFESVLPVPIDTIHAVFVPIDPGRMLACGMPLEMLGDHASRGWLTLAPESLPGFVNTDLEDPVKPRSLNLLVGEFEPARIRARRRRGTIIACAMLLLCAALVTVGHARRASRFDRHRRALEAATAAIYSQVLPPSSSPLPASARLTADLRSLDRTRGTPSFDSGPKEAAPLLATLLTSWPSDLYLTTDSLSISSTAITLSIRLPDEASAERFERELRAPPGWSLSQPNLTRERDEIVVRVRMEPEAVP